VTRQSKSRLPAGVIRGFKGDMKRFSVLAYCCLLSMGLGPSFAAQAQEAASTPPAPTPPAAAAPPPGPEKPAPYDARLLRLAEILGSVHYLRTLCKSEAPDSWRQAMQELLDKEAGSEAGRRARLTAAFNRGYRTFASVYTACTPPALVADERYRAEGATLASEIVARFGN
jgi:uncharacterized protein (TIGR02301 family)